MATGISSPSSRLDPASDPDHLPLAGRRRSQVQPPAQPRAEPSPPLPDRCEARVDAGDAGGASQQSWPGLPRGVEFNPSDSDLLWHLAAEVGNGLAHRHPFIDEFIKSVDDDRGFSCTHPRDIPGVRQDGRASYFFHRRFDSYSKENDENISWRNIGTPKSIIFDGTLQGCKEEFVLYVDMMTDNSPQKTDWMLHQYHIRNTVKDEEGLVVSKIFYGSQNNQSELAEEAHVESEWDVSTLDDSREESQILCPTGFNPEIQINGHTEADELDHISLQERYRIIMAAGKTVKGLGTSRTIPKRTHERTAYKEDICCMLQEIASAPPIVESNAVDDDRNKRLVGEDLSVGCCHDPVESTEKQLGGIASCGSKVVRKQGIFFGDVKLEPELEGCETAHCESPQANSTRVEGSVPSLGVKDERTECELPSLCESISFDSQQGQKRKASYSSEKTHEGNAYTNVEEGIAYCPRQRRRKKTATDSIEKALDEDAPGLLQILLNRGIAVEEIKLYDAEEDNEMLSDSSESNFDDLENVIANLFPKRESLLKLSVARYEKGERAIYCLSCLISLVEQSRYLQFRDCPVEWGWCRDLQSFIFVFRSHNRIVVERPEYGYATYFFEVVESLPIAWQIRRLVIAMKLSGCGRTALIENRPLLVSNDLTEGEALVLEEYGWIRNTGLGTMLNYRDRVVHNRWTEKCVSDWRAKIGKLLMSGYAQGQSVTSHSSTKLGDLLEGMEDTEVKVKLEDPF
ncbi:hypothetical protein BS78_01G434900 [Paspalum vaginatum]|nr:hypothetical protein BS78_01G434900 [Paspalum vaginatum]